jgi:hypothetical protein
MAVQGEGEIRPIVGAAGPMLQIGGRRGSDGSGAESGRWDRSLRPYVYDEFGVRWWRQGGA